MENSNEQCPSQDAGISKAATRAPVSQPPTECGQRDRAEDAAAGAVEIAHMLQRMDGNVIQRMVQAREAALNIYQAFPGGDQRFVDVEDDDDYTDDEKEGDEEKEEEEEEGVDDGEAGVIGLFDDNLDINPHACLQRAKTQHGFDVVSAMDDAALDILQRIRVVNWIRTLVRVEKLSSMDVIGRARELLNRGDGDDVTVLDDNNYLTPVIEGDLLLTVLESDEEQEQKGGSLMNGDSSGNGHTHKIVDSDDERLVRAAVMESLQNTNI